MPTGPWTHSAAQQQTFCLTFDSLSLILYLDKPEDSSEAAFQG
jgi:hypothetical protein